ncbi:hypothetical protein BH09ACT3_BH09ACT3_12790 [soil metagenome]
MTLHSADGQRAPAQRRREKRWTVAVHYGGRSFVATAEMAQIFAHRADAALAAGRSELVPLSHRDGLELLIVGAGTSYTIVELDEPDAARRRERPAIP